VFEHSKSEASAALVLDSDQHPIETADIEAVGQCRGEDGCLDSPTGRIITNVVMQGIRPRVLPVRRGTRHNILRRFDLCDPRRQEAPQHADHRIKFSASSDGYHQCRLGEFHEVVLQRLAHDT